MSGPLDPHGAGAGPEEAVRSHVAAFNDQDIESVVAGLAPDAEVRGPDGVGARGTVSLRALFTDAFAGPARVRLELRWVRARGTEVVCGLDRHIAIEGQATVMPGRARFVVDDAGRLTLLEVDGT